MAENKIIKFLRTRQITRSNFLAMQHWLFAFLLFLMIPPYFIWSTKINNLAVVLCTFFLLFKGNISLRNLVFFVAFFFLYIYIALQSKINLTGFVFLLLIPVLLLFKIDFIQSALNKFIKIYSISLIPSVLAFLLVNIFGVDLPYKIIEPYNMLKSSVYYQYPFFVQEDWLSQILPRFYGYFDEPGVVGTISGVLLALNGFSLKRKINIPILISGILSFSFAFYMILLLSGVLFIKNKYKIVFIVIIVSSYFVLQNNEILNTYIFSRLEIENGQLSGDNRTAAGFDDWYNEFKMKPEFLWGLGNDTSLTYNFGGASYKDLIVNYGIIFFVAFCGLFINVGLTNLKINRDFFLALFLFVAILYQRPFINNYFYFFLMYSPFLYLQKDSLIQKSK